MNTIEQKVAILTTHRSAEALVKDSITSFINDQDNYTLEHIVEDVIKFHTVLVAEYLEDITLLDNYGLTFEEVKPLVLKELVAMGEAGQIDCGINEIGKAVWTRSQYFYDYLGYESKKRLALIAADLKLRREAFKNTTPASIQARDAIIPMAWPFPY